MHYTVRQATRFDAANIAYQLRPEDDREVRAATGKHPKDVLPDGVVPGKTFVLEASIEQGMPGRMLAIFGVVKLSDELGCPWMVATPLLLAHQFYFLRHCKPWVDKLSSGFNCLANCVDARNELHIKWLKWCGFQFTKLHQEFGVAKIPFWQFEKVTNV